MVFLQRADIQAFTPDSPYAIDGGSSTRNCCNAGNVVIDGSPADRLFIEERFAAKGCIYDEIDFAALDIVDDVRPSFVNFIDRFHVDARTSEHACGSSRRDDFKTNFQQVSGNFRNEIFVVLIYADKGHSGLWQDRSRTGLSFDVSLPKRVVHAHDLTGRLHFGAQDRINTMEPRKRKHRRFDKKVVDFKL